VYYYGDQLALNMAPSLEMFQNRFNGCFEEFLKYIKNIVYLSNCIFQNYCHSMVDR